MSRRRLTKRSWWPSKQRSQVGSRALIGALKSRLVRLDKKLVGSPAAEALDAQFARSVQKRHLAHQTALWHAETVRTKNQMRLLQVQTLILDEVISVLRTATTNRGTLEDFVPAIGANSTTNQAAAIVGGTSRVAAQGRNHYQPFASSRVRALLEEHIGQRNWPHNPSPYAR